MMNKKFFCILLPVILAGCGSESDSNSGGGNDDFYDKYEGLYYGQDGSYMFFDDTENGALHDIVIVDGMDKTVAIPVYPETKGLNVSFSNFYQGMDPANWELITDSPNTIELTSDEKAYILDETLIKFKSQPLSSYRDLEITNGLHFKLTTNDCTYKGRYELDDNGYYELDDDYSMTNTCDNGLNQFNAEMYVFAKDSVAYSLIYDKNFKTVVSVTEHSQL